MYGTDASFLPDGSCRLSDGADGVDTTWGSLELWATDWFAEWRASDSGAADEFIRAACDHAVPGVVAALIVLAETAQGDRELLSWVGAGPLEDLVSHTGNGLAVLAEVDSGARRNRAFRQALANVWLGEDVPTSVKERLVPLGARDLQTKR